MSNNLDNERSVTSGKMYPIDLAPQKITIVKSVSSSDVKMSHLGSNQAKATGSAQILSHGGPIGIMRPGGTNISSVVVSQPQMIVSGSPILQSTQIVTQAPQLIGQNTQILAQSQLLGQNTPMLSPGTQIISQGSQLSGQVINSSNNSTNTLQVNVGTNVSGNQVLNVGGQLVSGTGNLVVSSSVRTLPNTVRVLPAISQHNPRPTVLSNVNVTSSGGVLVTKGITTSHVPRGLAAVSSLAVRPVIPSSGTHCGPGWSSRGPRSALVYGSRTTNNVGRSTNSLQPHTTIHSTTQSQNSSHTTTNTQNIPGLLNNTSQLQTALSSNQHQTGLLAATLHTNLNSATTLTMNQPTLIAATQPGLLNNSTIQQQVLPTVVTLSSNAVITTNVISTGVGIRGIAPRANAPLNQRPLPLLQRHYQPAKQQVVNSAIARGTVGNSAPTQLYYEVPRPANNVHQQGVTIVSPPPTISVPATLQELPLNSRVVNTTQPLSLQRHTILRKREHEQPPQLPPDITLSYSAGSEWEGVLRGGGGSGSTTVSAASSPERSDHNEPTEPIEHVIKKPRHLSISEEIHELPPERDEKPPTPPTPPTPVVPPPKRPQLGTSYVCGWRATALHFTRSSDVKRRDPRPKDIVAIANQKHVLTSAEGWKVHHITGQMNDLVSLEEDVSSQLSSVLRGLEGASGRAQSALSPQLHNLYELLKGNIQRSKIVCEGVQEAREDILRVFTHRNFVSDILTRQADKRCFRKHRSQS